MQGQVSQFVVIVVACHVAIVVVCYVTNTHKLRTQTKTSKYFVIHI